MWELQLIYTSGKKYTIPFSVVEKYVDSKTIAKIKTEVMKEINKL